MSSYHVLNTLWIGIFPMLAVSIVVGLVFYLFCCLNNIKEHCVEYCVKRKKTKSRKHSRKEKKADIENQNSESDTKKTNSKKKPSSRRKKSWDQKCLKSSCEIYLDDDNEDTKKVPRNNEKIAINNQADDEYFLNTQETNSIIKNSQNLTAMQLQRPPPLPLTVPPPQKDNLEKINSTELQLESAPSDPLLDRAALSLDLRKNYTTTSTKPKSIIIPRNREKEDFTIYELDSEPKKLKPGLLIDSSNIIHSSKSLNIMETVSTNVDKFNMNNSNNNIEQLIVQELKESPKSIYSRLKSLRNRNQRKSSIEPPIIFDMDRSPNSGIKYKFLNLPIPKEKTQQSEAKVLIDESQILKKSDNKSIETSGSISLDDSLYSLGNSYDRTSSANSSNNNLSRTKTPTNNNSPMARASSSPKRLTKKHYRKTKNASSSCLNSPRETRIKNAANKKLEIRKKQSFATNRIHSDFEIEDELIFNNDDNDSLSSTGHFIETLTRKKPNSQKGSQITLTNRSLLNLKAKKKASSENIDCNTAKDAASEEPCYRSASVENAHLVNPEDTFSDIDPDENILTNLLVKKSSPES